jgi:hypothetical protein
MKSPAATPGTGQKRGVRPAWPPLTLAIHVISANYASVQILASDVHFRRRKSGAAIHALKPDLDAKAVESATIAADEQAKNDRIEASASADVSRR